MLLVQVLFTPSQTAFGATDYVILRFLSSRINLFLSRSRTQKLGRGSWFVSEDPNPHLSSWTQQEHDNFLEALHLSR
ncbi:unnamed protein product [Arabidopsis halleri]